MLTPNTLLNGRYRIEKLIGQGGMGAVYKAYDNNLCTTVAVKEATVTDTRLLGAFEKEAQRLARLRHSALPRVIDHFTEGYGHYLVMEFIEGEDLADKLQARGQPLGVDEVVGLGEQLLQVLEYLHRQQPAIIHRDIKPQNIKVMPDGSLILLDFGLAKGGLTQQNTYGSKSLFAYSVGYGPPEQMNALGTDERSDLYSVAATLWTLLTAQRAIDAQVREQAAKHGIPDPMRPANELNPHVPSLVAQALTRALALNRHHRPKSATQMRQQLQAETERKRQAQDAHRQAEVERLQREVEREKQQREAVERQVEAERERRAHQQAQDARRQAEVERLRREAEARHQAEVERLRREAEAARRQAERERQQRAAASQQRATSFATPPSQTSAIKRLSSWNPLNYLRLLWWTLVMPQQLKAYREQYGENAERPVSKWLVSTLIWLPFILPSLAVTVQTFLRGADIVSFTLLLSIMFIGWLLTGVFGNRVILAAGIVIRLVEGVTRVRTRILAALLLVGVLAAILAGLQPILLLGLLTSLLVVGLGVVVDKSLKTGRPSWLARGAFGLLVAGYALLVLVCFSVLVQ